MTDLADVVVNNEGNPSRLEDSVAEVGLTTETTLLGAYRDDIVAISVLILFTVVALWLRFVYDNWLSEPDVFTFFIPWFGYIGDRLRDFDIPAWSQNYFGGTPVVGSPSSGWMYLPVMVLFPLFTIITAFKALVLMQVLIGGSATYALSRRIGLGPMAALASTSAFVLGPLIYASTRYIMVGSQVTTWIPVGLLATEMAFRAPRLPAVLGWSALAGIAISQIFVAWPGQGLMYGLLWIGGWILYRTVFAPVDAGTAFRERIVRAVIAGSAMVLLGFAFAAAGILPLLDYSAQSNIPNGDYSQVMGGNYATPPHSLRLLLYYFFSDSFGIRAEGFGGALMILAALGIVVARRRYGASFFAMVLIVGASLAVKGSPTVPLFNLIPYFDQFHGHRPIAILWVLSLAPAMLAGAAVQQLLNAQRRPIPLVPIVGTFLVTLLTIAAISSNGSWIGWWPILTMILTIWLFALPSLDLAGSVARWRETPPRIVAATLFAMVLLAFAVLNSMWEWNGWWLVGAIAVWLLAYVLPSLNLLALVDRWRFEVSRVAAVGLIGLMFLFPTGVDIARTVANPETPPGGFTKQLGKDEPTDWVVDHVLAREDPGTAAAFLQHQQELLAPFRYTGYSGQGYPAGDYTWVYNTFWWRRMEPGIVGILMNARTVRLDLEQTSGYNPVQFKGYADYIDAMNGARQDYHWTDTYASALFGSQLLDMLNVRYVLVDAATPRDRADFIRISRRFNEVYRDNLTIVFENPRVFPRAWMVHVVRPENNGDGLAQLADGSVDGRFVAFVDGPIPPVTVPPGQGGQAAVPREQVVITGRTPESMTLRATAGTDGLLVVSAAYADGWNASVDGEHVDVLRTNHAFQGVPLAAGEHTVVLEYEPRSLTIGLWSTGLASVAMIGIWSWAYVDIRRRRSSATTHGTGGKGSGVGAILTRVRRGRRRPGQH